MRCVVETATSAPPAPAFTHRAKLVDDTGYTPHSRLGYSERGALISLRGALKGGNEAWLRLVVERLRALPVCEEGDAG